MLLILDLIINKNINTMEKYIDYILTAIINDVNYFETIYNNFAYCTWLFIWPLWLIWILLKFTLLTFPIWQTFNLTIGNINFRKFIPKK